MSGGWIVWNGNIPGVPGIEGFEMGINLRESFCSLGRDFSVRAACSWLVEVTRGFVSNHCKEFGNRMPLLSLFSF